MREFDVGIVFCGGVYYCNTVPVCALFLYVLD